MESSGLVISNSGFNTELKPNPLHSGHAPKGELNEKNVGSNLPIVKSQYGQLKCSLNKIRSSLMSTKIFPSDNLQPVSNES